MTLREFIDTLPSLKDWCEANDLNPNLISQVASEKTQRRPGPKLAKKISIASGGLVPLAQLRSDLWG